MRTNQRRVKVLAFLATCLMSAMLLNLVLDHEHSLPRWRIVAQVAAGTLLFAIVTYRNRLSSRLRKEQARQDREAYRQLVLKHDS